LVKRASVAIVLALVVLASCAGSGKKATVTGTLVMNVGLAPIKPVSGDVAARRPDGSVAGQASVGADGRFKLSLPPGTYAFVGHSPSFNDGIQPCKPTTGSVTATADQTVEVNVECDGP
jgi:hypothetical protein